MNVYTGGIRRNSVIYLCAGTITKLRVVQSWGLQTECFPLSPSFIVLQALCSAWGCCLFLHTRTASSKNTHTHKHMRALFMWERMGQVWISLSPCVTLDNAFNISSLPCPNSVLAQAESGGLENPRAAVEFWCDPLFNDNDSINACRPETWPIQI